MRSESYAPNSGRFRYVVFVYVTFVAAVTMRDNGVRNNNIILGTVHFGMFKNNVRG